MRSSHPRNQQTVAQHTHLCLAHAADQPVRQANDQKFFGSFFQERTVLLFCKKEAKNACSSDQNLRPYQDQHPGLDDLVAMAGREHPIPSRTRP
jgi:hypothetical protein